MDQRPELLNYKHFIEAHRNISKFNFTSADDILQDFENSLWTLSRFSTVTLLAMYAPIFIIGLLGNLLIIVSVSAEKVRKANLYFHVNLALADLTVTVMCMPTSIGTIVYRLWVYGRILCKFVAFIQGVAVTVSIFSMTAMSVERYITLRSPTSNRITTPRQAFLLIACMWLIAIVIMGPLVFIRQVDEIKERFLPSLPFCIEKWPHDRDRHAYGVFLLFIIFIIPAFTIGVCYGQIGKALFTTQKTQRVSSDGSTQRLITRKQAARMIIILICVFMICWFPYNVISALADLSESAIMVKSLPFVLWLGHAHSAFNPMLYWSLNRRFRENVRRLVKVVKISGCSTTTNSTISLPQYV